MNRKTDSWRLAELAWLKDRNCALTRRGYVARVQECCAMPSLEVVTELMAHDDLDVNFVTRVGQAYPHLEEKVKTYLQNRVKRLSETEKLRRIFGRIPNNYTGA